MHRIIAILFFLFATLSARTQCSDCFSLDEALKDPDRVVRLDLHNTGLKQLPRELALFTNLRELDLSDNQLVDFSLPQPLHQLKRINLSRNAPNPGKIEDLHTLFPNLERLDLSHCRLAAIPPYALLFPKLKELDLSDNGLTAIPIELGELGNLEILNLNDNLLWETDAVLGGLWKLRSLHIMRNPDLNESAVLNSVKASTTLNELALTCGNWRSETQQILAELPLKIVILDGLNANFPRGISENKTIESVVIHAAATTDKLAASLSKMAQLSELKLVESAIPADLEKVSQLKKLSIHSSSTANISAISSWDFLQELDIANTQLDAAVANELAMLLPETTIITTYQEISPEMSANQLEPIVEIPWFSTTFSATESHVVEVDDVIFAIPSNGFLLPDGSLYTEAVDFKVKVYNDALSMALDGAPMGYTSNGRNEIFTSDGMIDVRASTIDGQPLIPNPDQPIEVSMPDLQPELETDLYYFDTVTNNWQLAAQEPATINNNEIMDKVLDSLNSLDLTRFINLREADRLFAIDYKKKSTDASQLTFNTFLPSATVLSNRRNLIVTRRLHEGKLIAGQTWHIDTMITPELSRLLKNCDQSYNLSKRYINSKRFNFRSEPRILSDLHITPDFVRDNYRLTFRFRDSLVNLPVYLESSTNKNAMIRHKRFQDRLVKAMRSDKRELKRIEVRKKAIVRNYVDLNRAAVLNNLMVVESGPGDPERENILDATRKAGRAIGRVVFTIVTFGLINCDAISRPRPIRTLSLRPKLVNQDNLSFNAPANVRIVLTGSYSYMTLASSNIPIVPNDRMMILMDLPDKQLGVMYVNPNTTRLPEEIKTFDIAGKSADEVKRLIMAGL